jgi:hypothetical protein
MDQILMWLSGHGEACGIALSIMVAVASAIVTPLGIILLAWYLAVRSGRRMQCLLRSAVRDGVGDARAKAIRGGQ